MWGGETRPVTRRAVVRGGKGKKVVDRIRREGGGRVDLAYR